MPPRSIAVAPFDNALTDMRLPAAQRPPDLNSSPASENKNIDLNE